MYVVCYIVSELVYMKGVFHIKANNIYTYIAHDLQDICMCVSARAYDILNIL